MTRDYHSLIHPSLRALVIQLNLVQSSTSKEVSDKLKCVTVVFLAMVFKGELNLFFLCC